MELVSQRGETLPLLPVPGGEMLIGVGDGCLYLKSRGDRPLAFEGRLVHLNPHYRPIATGGVKIERHDGRPAGSAFFDDESGDDLDLPARERLFAALGEALSAALAADPDLRDHVASALAEARLAGARRTYRDAAGAVARAGAELARALDARPGGTASQLSVLCLATDPDGAPPSGELLAAVARIAAGFGYRTVDPGA